MNKPFVSIKTITYNHEKYIARCIEGVLNQKTKYSFEYIIGEDCSTDKTMQIVQDYAKKYPDIIKIVSSDCNVGAAENDHRTDLACKGKYVAFCEGDDYWTDPYKIEKQVNFLEANPDYGLVHTNFSVVEGDKLLNRFRGDTQLPSGNVLYQLLKGNHIATATVCMKNELLQKLQIGETIINNHWKMGDYPLWIEVAAQTKVHYMKDDTMTYRIHPTSVTHGLDLHGDFQFFEDRYKIKRYYIDKYNCSELSPIISKMYYRELLKYAIFFKDDGMRNKCNIFFKTTTNNMNPYRILSQYKVLDILYCFLYTSRKKIKMIV